MIRSAPMFSTELLSSRLRSWLVEEMTYGVFKDAEKLPAEADLAKMMKVSRSVIRDALLDLECDGFVSRLRGIGTLINHHVLRVPLRLDWEIDYATMLSEAGYTARLLHSFCRYKTADELIAEKLDVPVGTRLVEMEKMVLADEKPAILFTDYIREELLEGVDLGQIHSEESAFEIIETYCNEAVFLNLSEVEAILPDESLAHKMGIEIGKPLLHLTGVGYDKYGNAELFSNVYYVSGLYRFSVLRKKR